MVVVVDGVVAVEEAAVTEAAVTEDHAAVLAGIFAGALGARDILTKVAVEVDTICRARRCLSPRDSTVRSKRRVSCPKSICRLPPVIPWCTASGSIEF